MGYTHYYTFKKVPRGQADQTETTYQLAIRQCQRIILAYNAQVKAINDKHPDRLSGYSAHTKVSKYGGLNFNGTGDLSHEPFTAREHYSQNLEEDFQPGFNCCKTNRKPYDIVVTACLITLKHYLGDLIEVSSDGDASDWDGGLKLAREVLKIKGVKNPIIPSSFESKIRLVHITK